MNIIKKKPQTKDSETNQKTATKYHLDQIPAEETIVETE